MPRGLFDGSFSYFQFFKIILFINFLWKNLTKWSETKACVLNEQMWLKTKNFNLINDDKVKFYINSFISRYGIVRNIQLFLI